MRLIGKLDSPYVRRVAVSLHLLGLGFEHEDLSVFRDFAAFSAINPVVKAPTLVTDDGIALVDSTLILAWLDRLVPAERRLGPDDPSAFARHQRIVGLALAACEKTVQIVYEQNLRPEDKQHQPWLDRVAGQLGAAYRLLEAEIGQPAPWLFGGRPTDADVTAAIAWHFTQSHVPGRIEPDHHPNLARFAAAAEQSPAFRSAPPD